MTVRTIFRRILAHTAKFTASPRADFTGAHAAVAWSQTGENRSSRCRMSSGEFKRLRPNQHFDLKNGGISAQDQRIYPAQSMDLLVCRREIV